MSKNVQQFWFDSFHCYGTSQGPLSVAAVLHSLFFFVKTGFVGFGLAFGWGALDFFSNSEPTEWMCTVTHCNM